MSKRTVVIVTIGAAELRLVSEHPVHLHFEAAVTDDLFACMARVNALMDKHGLVRSPD